MMLTYYCAVSVLLSKVHIRKGTVDSISEALRGSLVVEHTTWHDARKQALALLAAGKIPCLLGSSGVGKSMLLADLRDWLGSSGINVQALDGTSETQDLSGGAYVVDDAEEAHLITLRSIIDRAKICVLAGSETLRERLCLLSDRIVVVEVGSILPNDMTAYAQEILRQHGMATDHFSASELAALYRQTMGLPKSVNNVIGLAAIVARLNGSEEVSTTRSGRAVALSNTPADPLRAAASTDDQPSRSPVAWRQPAHLAAMIGAVVAISLIVAASQIPNILPVPFAKFLSAAIDPVISSPISKFVTAELMMIARRVQVPIAPATDPVTSSARTETVGTAQAPAIGAGAEPMPTTGPLVEKQGLPNTGLVILVREGDTLPVLFSQIYQGVTPPPFEMVAAMNHSPLVPGSLAIFPTPTGGWTTE
jgi:hypothetical protein